MPSSKANVRTEKASVNLKKLCRHFGHKLDVSFDDHRGEIRFPFGGIGYLTAADSSLHIAAEADDDESIGRIEQILTDHLVRFAHKEQLQIEWERV